MHDGDQVKAGDIVVRLDDTQTRANLAIVVKALTKLAARQAREEAERDGADTVDFPERSPRAHGRSRRRQGGQRRAQAIRDPPHVARGSARASSRERIAQLRQEITGYEAQIASKIKQIEWITKELAGVNELWEKNLVPYTRVTSARAREGAARGRARPVGRLHRPVQGQDHRDRAADPADRPGHAQRRSARTWPTSAARPPS